MVLLAQLLAVMPSVARKLYFEHLLGLQPSKHLLEQL